MRYPHRTAAFVSGVVLFFAWAYATDVLLYNLPLRNYYSGMNGLTVARNNVFGIVLPSFVFSLAGSWAIMRWLAKPPRIAVWWCLGGLIVGYICLVLYSGVERYWSHTLWELECRDREKEYLLLQLQSFGSIRHWSNFCQYGIPAWYHADQPWRSIIGYLSAEGLSLITMTEAQFLSLISGLATAAALALRTRTNRTSGGAHVGESYSAPKGGADDAVGDPRIHLRATPAY